MLVLVPILFRSVPCRGTEPATLLSTGQDSRKEKIGHLDEDFLGSWNGFLVLHI